MPLTTGQKLDLCMRRKMHVTDIQDPMVKALWWKRWERKNQSIIDECGRSPDYADLVAQSEREVEIARAARRKILVGLRSTSVLDRIAASYAPEAVAARAGAL
jgi:hypothetical protein